MANESRNDKSYLINTEGKYGATRKPTEIKYTTNEHGITKVQAFAQMKDGKDYMFTYSVDYEVKDGAEQIFYVAEIGVVPNNKLMRGIGIKKNLMTYRSKKCCPVSCRHINSEERKKMRVFDTNLGDTYFEPDKLSGGYLYPNAHLEADYSHTIDADQMEDLIQLDIKLREQIASKVEEMKQTDMPEFLKPQRKANADISEEDKNTLQGRNIFPVTGHSVDCESVNIPWQRVKRKVKKVELAPIDPASVKPEVIIKQTAEQIDAARTERAKALYQKWQEEQKKSGKDSK